MFHDPDLFRRALGSFPTGVAIISARGLDGRPVGLTANSFTSISLEPPLVAWALRLSSTLLDDFRAAAGFAVNVLAASQVALARRFARSAPDRFAGVALRESSGPAPLLAGCIAHFECAPEGSRMAGDHVVFTGRVHRSLPGGAEGAPLVFWRGAYMAPRVLMAAEEQREAPASAALEAQWTV
jgi:flavin reductase (DIM6/NTAB) family NADH-FMN oxidoreductase RutF